MRRVLAAVLLLAPPAFAGPPVERLRITTLSTMLTDARGIGEWGYAALVETDRGDLLFDTGDRPRTVLENAAELGVDLSHVRRVVLSHNHGDHTGGLLTLRRELRERDPQALSEAHVGKGIRLERPDADPGMQAVLEEYASLGGSVRTHDGPEQILPGVWVTGTVPRVTDEHNYSASWRVRSEGALVPDVVPEDMSLAIETPEGLVVLSGCGHAGLVNTLLHARASTGEPRVAAAIGGFHLLAASDAQLDWTGARLAELGVRRLMGAHCTGLEALYHLRRAAGLDRATAVVGAVGAVYEQGRGFEPGRLAR